MKRHCMQHWEEQSDCTRYNQCPHAFKFYFVRRQNQTKSGTNCFQPVAVIVISVLFPSGRMKPGIGCTGERKQLRSVCVGNRLPTLCEEGNSFLTYCLGKELMWVAIVWALFSVAMVHRRDAARYF